MGKEAAVLKLRVARTKCFNITIALNTGCELQGATATSAFLDGLSQRRMITKSARFQQPSCDILII